MAADGRQLESLIKDLQKSTSRLDQLKILSRAWRVLKGLSPRQRMEVATHLGLEEGLPLLESLGSPGGLSPATLARAVAKAERAHRGELDGILLKLKTPGRRLEALREGIELVDTSLHEEEKTPALPPAPEVRKPPPLPPPPAPPVAKPEPTPAPTEPLKPPPPKEVEPPPPAAKILEKAQAAPLEPQEAAAAPPAPKPEKAPTPPEASAAGMESRWAELSRPAVKATPLAPPMAAVSAKSLTARFRELNRLLEAGDLTPGQVGPLLADFPQGWPRRRALTAVIRTRAVQDVEALLTEITRLERPLDEFWCISALVHSRELSPAQLEEALNRVRAPSSRRLLQRFRE